MMSPCPAYSRPTVTSGALGLVSNIISNHRPEGAEGVTLHPELLGHSLWNPHHFFTYLLMHLLAGWFFRVYSLSCPETRSVD